MRKSLKSMLGNLSYSVVSNLVSFIVSSLSILLIPKFIGIYEYGYWQLYILYIYYIGFTHLGLIDGIYLRNGGKDYGKLEKDKISSQFWFLIFFELIIVLVFFIIYSGNIQDENKKVILLFTMLNCIISIPTTMLSYILQATNRIKEYALIILIDRSLYIILVLISFITKSSNLELLIFFDVLSKIVGLFIAILSCRDIVFHRLSPFKTTISEVKINISAGYKLMFANITNVLIIGIIKIGIENSWNIEVFGKVSLVLSLSNILMIFVNSISIIIFPILHKIKKETLGKIYPITRSLLMLILVGVLTFYFPIKYIICVWLPQYKDSIQHLALIFPMCIYESKMGMIINPYMKRLRQEKAMLKINIMTLSISVLLTYITAVIINNLNLVLISIVVVYAFRCIISEIYIAKFIKVDIKKYIFEELIISFIFILINSLINSWISYFINLICFGIYIYINRRNIILIKESLRLLY